MLPSLINFDRKGPGNQVINFAWPNVNYFIMYRFANKTDNIFFTKQEAHLDLVITVMLIMWINGYYGTVFLTEIKMEIKLSILAYSALPSSLQILNHIPFGGF